MTRRSPRSTAKPTRYVAFVRNVMVGRQGLTRAALIDVFGSAGGREPISHLVTGNVSFETTTDPESIGHAAKLRIAEIIGREEPVFIRSLRALQRRVAGRPFAQAPWPEAHERCITFASVRTRALQLPHVSKREDSCLFARAGSDVYSVTRLRDRRPGAPGRELERLLGAPVTTRNWNTVERIVAAHGLE